MKLSIIVPVYNEARTIAEIFKKIEEVDIEKQIIIIDDCSTDGTKIELEKLESDVKVIYHNRNEGKGACIKIALKYITGGIVIIQDADLEYDPNDYPKLIKPIEEGKADVVYGSRILGRGDFYPLQYIGNRFLTLVFNLCYQTKLTDMETCYKVVDAKVIKGLNLESKGFEIEAELSAKLIKSGYKIYEVPISYKARKVQCGKKIGWRDAAKAFYALIRYRFTPLDSKQVSNGV